MTSTEFVPISDGCRTELIILLDSVSRDAVKGVVREEQILNKVLINVLKPSTMPN